MKKLIQIGAAVAVLCLLFTACPADPGEHRPVEGMTFTVATKANSKDGILNEDGSITATLSQSSDSGLVLYLTEDKSEVAENAVVSYTFKYKTTTWGDSSPNPKFLVRYGDANSNWSGYDPSYADKTNYEDASSKEGTIKNTIKIKSAASAIVFATNGYQWAGDSADTVEITVTGISVAE